MYDILTSYMYLDMLETKTFILNYAYTRPAPITCLYYNITYYNILEILINLSRCQLLVNSS